MAGPYINLNMRPIANLPLQSEHAPGAGSRDKWDTKENSSPSVLDGSFLEIRESHIAQARTKKEAEGPVKKKLTTVEEVATYTDKCSRMVLSSETIKDHMEDRITAFFMQIIDCYDTDLHFTIGHTQDQTKSTPAIKFEIQAGLPRPLNTDLKMTFASAHHGTIPCLYAYPRIDWETWKINNNPNAAGKPQAKVYLNKSDTYYLNNACTGVATIINQADIDVDGNPTENLVEFPRVPKLHHDKKLRELTIELLNRAAKKEITPVQGFGLYMIELKRLVDALDAQFPQGEKHIIFSTWKTLLEELNARYAENYKLFIAKILGIHIPNADRDAINLKELLNSRFKIMQKKNTYQTELAFRVDQLKNNILLGAAKKPKLFDKAFKLALLTEASTQDHQIRQIFQRYYNTNGQTVEQLQLDCNATCKPALRLVQTEESKRKINAFFVNFRQYMHNFSIDQAKFSSGLSKEIRELRGLSLRKFADKHNRLFPHAHRLNHEQLRRIELGCTKPDSGLIGRIARVLDVHESVLKTEFS